MAELTYGERKKLPKSAFIFPKKVKKGPRGGKETHGAYPIPDPAHARNALARVSQFGSPSQKAKVRAAVHKKFPSIGKKGHKKAGRGR